MARFEDQNGVTWDIKTTTTTVDPGQTTGKFVAVIADDSAKDYTGNTSNRDFETTNNHIVWSANGNPIIDGPGGDNAALIAVKQFAAAEAGVPQAQRTIVTRKLTTQAQAQAQTSGAESALVPILLIATLVYFADR
jgi:hypothetical protein